MTPRTNALNLDMIAPFYRSSIHDHARPWQLSASARFNRSRQRIPRFVAAAQGTNKWCNLSTGHYPLPRIALSRTGSRLRCRQT